jgi:RNA polymerase sigma factor FliA
MTHIAPVETATATAPAPNLDDLVTTHLPLVGHLVNERIGRLPTHVRKDDLLSAGYAALVSAARGFDPTKGVPFGRYAALRVRGALVDELRSADWASRSVRAAARRREAAQEELQATLGRMPTAEELAAHLGVDTGSITANNEDVTRALVLSMDGFGPETDLGSVLPDAAPTPGEALEARERVGYLIDAVAELPAALRAVIEGYFLAERSMAEIAEELSVTVSRVSQMRSEALLLLKDAINSQLDPAQVTPLARPTGCVARRREAYFTAVANRSDFRTRLGHTTRPVAAAA